MNRRPSSLPGPMAADEHGAMIRPRLVAALGLLGAACATAVPRLPFQSDTGNWHVSVVGTERETDDRYLDQHSLLGVQVTTVSPGSGGWGWEFGVQWASNVEGDDSETIRTSQPNGSGGSMRVDLSVPTHRKSDVYELSLGTRQFFRPDARLQPYFGVGGTFIKVKSVDTFDLSGLPPATQNPQNLLTEEHHHDNNLGMYFRTGLQWNVLRDQLGKNTEVVISLDLHGMYGSEFSYIELGLGVGFGK